jgi:hypothetical protein
MTAARSSTAKASLVRVGRLLVDIPAVAGVAHRCDPKLCSHRQSCCSQYEVVVDADEVERMIGLIDRAKHFLSYDQAAAAENPFDPFGAFHFAIDTDEHGQCVFAYRNASGMTLCSLHAAAAELSIPYFQAKPESCCLWPLALSEDRPQILTVHEGAMAFPCNRRRRGRRDRLDPGVAEIVEGVFGRWYLSRLNSAVGRWARRA